MKLSDLFLAELRQMCWWDNICFGFGLFIWAAIPFLILTQAATDGVRMDCSHHGSQSLPPQAQAKDVVCSSYRLMLKKTMTCPGLSKLCVCTKCCLHPAILLTVLILTWKSLTIEAVVHRSLRAAVSHSRPWGQGCIQVLLFLEHDILKSSPRRDMERCHTRQGCRELQVNPACPSVSAQFVSLPTYAISWFTPNTGGCVGETPWLLILSDLVSQLFRFWVMPSYLCHV